MPINPKIIWPAVIFAASRKDRVIGRTIILRVSTITRNGFNQSGAPPGNKEAVADIGALINPEIIKDNQRGKPRISVIISWLDILKEYGINPIKLVMISIINKDVTILENIFKWAPNVRFDCEFITSCGVEESSINLEGASQKQACRGRSALTAVNQNRDG